MDRRFSVLLLIVAFEALARFIYPQFDINGVAYTLILRIIEIGLIIGLAFNCCGIKTQNIRREITIGIGVAAGFGLSVLAIEGAARIFRPDGIILPLLGVMQPNNLMLYLLTAVLIAPLAEELYFRGIFYPLLRQRLPSIGAIPLSALMFAMLHGMFNPVQLIGGLIFAVLYEWRGNIWAAYIVHAAANCGIWLVPQILIRLN